MLLTITSTRPPATDLGYLLHKNPSRPQTFELAFGKAHVFYPEASYDRCTAALLLDMDPVDLVRGRRDSAGEGRLFDYVNDRPYVASSFLSVAMSRVFGSALGGRSKDRPELVEEDLPLQAGITMLPCKGGESMIRRLFEPLGYKVSVTGYALDEQFPDWGESSYYDVVLEAECKLKDMLNHIYVLIPVMDREKHYWVGEDEVEKLLRHGSGWLAGHPEREMIASRYLRRQRSLVNKALSKLMEEDLIVEYEEVDEITGTGEELPEKTLNLNQQRLGSVVAVLKSVGAQRVIDLGCGEGNLIRVLLNEKSFTEIAGIDVSYRSLEKAKDRLKLDRMPEMQKKRLTIFQSSLFYRDKRFEGYDAATVTEVIEHMDKHRLAAFERVLFEFARPKTIIITTPNKEYNARYSNLLEGNVRHSDHRFEWTRGEFQSWAEKTALRFGYKVRFLPVGDEDPELGAPTQMGVFTL
ncbi:MAG: 3' terminal RNA ribose 2'-O-methyltransferase Hen1 [Peptococcaceae bacterium]|nr:3' terminal RNA ribose 2'-O-methyltransferase Hen1 [Peptococcaceae bacterium]